MSLTPTLKEKQPDLLSLHYVCHFLLRTIRKFQSQPTLVPAETNTFTRSNEMMQTNVYRTLTPVLFLDTDTKEETMETIAGHQKPGS